MDYITVSQAAEKWGLSSRWIETLLKDKRIDGAIRPGRDWMIPADAEKPGDLRRKKQPLQKPLAARLADVIAATYIPAPRNNPAAFIDAVNEERLRIIPEMILAYARGDFQQLKRCFQQIGKDDAVKLCACPTGIAAAISLGDYPFYIEIETYLKSIIKADAGGSAAAFAELALAIAHLGAMAPRMAPGWLKEGDFMALPPRARLDAAYLRAKYFQSIGDFESMLLVAQTALTFCGSEQGLTLTETYLRLTCADACYALNRMEEAKRRLLEVMRINLPHGFISPFAELVSRFGGLIEQCLEQEFPAYYDAVLGQWKRIFVNWVAFHNQFTKDNITHILSLRDYQMALLVVRGMPYTEVAKQFGISVGRLNNIMQDICGKLFVSGKKELKKFIL